MLVPVQTGIEGFTVLAKPARPFPACAHNDIGTLFQNMRQRIGMHEPAIGDGNIPFGKGRAIEPFAAPRLRGSMLFSSVSSIKLKRSAGRSKVQ